MDTRELQGFEYDECYPLNDTRIKLQKYQGCQQHNIFNTVKHMILEFQGTIALKIIP